MAEPTALGIAGCMREQALVVALSGALTAGCGERFLDALASPPWRLARSIELDLSGIDACDQAGARVLLDAHIAIALRQGSMRVTGIKAETYECVLASGGHWFLAACDAAPSARGVFA